MGSGSNPKVAHSVHTHSGDSTPISRLIRGQYTNIVQDGPRKNQRTAPGRSPEKKRYEVFLSHIS
jgi:hypothetical protein